MAKKSKILGKDLMTGIRKKMNKELVKQVEDFIKDKLYELEEAKALVLKIEKEIEEVKKMDATEVIGKFGRPEPKVQSHIVCEYCGRKYYEYNRCFCHL